MLNTLQKILPAPSSTQTGARLAELQTRHQKLHEAAEQARSDYAELVEKAADGDIDTAAASKAQAKHRQAVEMVELMADQVAAAQRRHDKALEVEERARKADLWHRVTELSHKRTEAAEEVHDTIATLSRQVANVARLGSELAQLAPFRADSNGGAARLMRADLDSLVGNELYRTGVTRLPCNDSLLGDRPVMVDVLRDAEHFILQLRNDALRG